MYVYIYMQIERARKRLGIYFGDNSFLFLGSDRSVFTCCGIVTLVRNVSECDGQREEVTLDAALGLWLVCFEGK